MVRGAARHQGQHGARGARSSPFLAPLRWQLERALLPNPPLPISPAYTRTLLLAEGCAKLTVQVPAWLRASKRGASRPAARALAPRDSTNK